MEEYNFNTIRWSKGHLEVADLAIVKELSEVYCIPGALVMDTTRHVKRHTMFLHPGGGKVLNTLSAHKGNNADEPNGKSQDKSKGKS